MSVQRLKWSRSKVLRQLKTLPTGVATHSQLISVDPRVASAARTHFGSVARAFKAAGRPYRALERWNPQKIKGLIRGLPEGVETHDAVFALNPKLVSASVKYCGSLRKAFTTAGRVYAVPPQRTRFTRDEITTQINRLLSDRIKLYSKNSSINRLLVDDARHVYGSWPAAVFSAGVSSLDFYLFHSLTTPRGFWTKENVPLALQKLSEKGFKLTERGLGSRFDSFKDKAREFYGSFPAAVNAAGFQSGSEKVFAARKEASLRNFDERLKRLHEDSVILNADSNHPEIRRLRGILWEHKKTGEWDFNWMERVMRVTGMSDVEFNLFHAKKVRNSFWTRDKLVEAVSLWSERKGNLSSTILNMEKREGFKNALYREFGSVDAALKAAKKPTKKKLRQAYARDARREFFSRLRALRRTDARLSVRSTDSRVARLVSPAVRLFGSWRNAVFRSGVSPLEYYFVHCSHMPASVRRDDAFIKSALESLKAHGVPLYAPWLARLRGLSFAEEFRSNPGKWRERLESVGTTHERESREISSIRRLTPELLENYSEFIRTGEFVYPPSSNSRGRIPALSVNAFFRLLRSEHARGTQLTLEDLSKNGHSSVLSTVKRASRSMRLPLPNAFQVLKQKAGVEIAAEYSPKQHDPLLSPLQRRVARLLPLGLRRASRSLELSADAVQDEVAAINRLVRAESSKLRNGSTAQSAAPKLGANAFAVQQKKVFDVATLNLDFKWKDLLAPQEPTLLAITALSEARRRALAVGAAPEKANQEVRNEFERFAARQKINPDRLREMLHVAQKRALLVAGGL